MATRIATRLMAAAGLGRHALAPAQAGTGENHVAIDDSEDGPSLEVSTPMPKG